MKQGFADVDGVNVTFAVFGSPLGLIHLAVGFAASFKGCYVTRLHQVRSVSVLAAIYTLK
jgi:hypothetical protein